ncbi:hypothetical protein [Lederbergia citrea]|uniref:Uncharacterized protein n=1 Tax=Lederbergia citrea TaxID=2833581 RepID=A0A942UTP0_9BACI|nr:hypothetical protein [Lederbergia citrea]MBS4176043.1 hypothetical protein [Lederbergia citrea]MBS4202605.1 hypothetical protein [Lederbergia citrea]MBS4222729.1 hypothetical protein [Lederbergia citrea]
MKKRRHEEQFQYDEQGQNETVAQIMDVYASGVMDQPDGQLHLYEQSLSDEE